MKSGDTAGRSRSALDKFIGQSEWTQRVRRRIGQIANHKYGVLITGPSGTGKELIARAVHTCSERHARPFIPVNCAAIPTGLFSSQLFGHVKGAFTGAQFASIGCFRAADQGTIFLDEVGELDLDCQAKLLRVLQEKVVTPVGSTDEITVDVRTVAATNRNLIDEVRAGRFRLDLYYRLNVISVETLGLADRRDDILGLASHFLAKTAVECGSDLKYLSPAAMTLLEQYEWPGNVRELENCIERAVVFSESSEIGPEAFDGLHSSPSSSLSLPMSSVVERAGQPPASDVEIPPPMIFPGGATNEEFRRQPQPPISPDQPLRESKWPTLAQIEARHIRATLRETYFNQSAAARLLGIDRKSLARKMKKYGIELSDQHRRSN